MSKIRNLVLRALDFTGPATIRRAPRPATLAQLSAAGLLTLGLAACGGANPATSQPPQPVPAETTTSPATATATEKAAPVVHPRTAALVPGEAAGPGETLRSDLANSGTSNYTMNDFLTFVLTDVDQFWSAVWSQAGYPEPYVRYAFPAPGEAAAVAPECIPTGQSDDSTAAYCTADDQIVISQQVATQVWEGQLRTNTDPQGEQPAGDFSVAYVVAHEYAHSLQGELGLLPTLQDPTLKFPVYRTELHADCWAGVWANSAYHKAILEPGDIEEATRTTKDVGDYNADHPQHHGTPQQRAEAFMAGYNAGDPRSCDPYLLGQ